MLTYPRLAFDAQYCDRLGVEDWKQVRRSDYTYRTWEMSRKLLFSNSAHTASISYRTIKLIVNGKKDVTFLST